MRLDDLFERDGVDWAEERGLVSVQDHPDLPLAIANYTHKAQYDRAWNPVTVNCRGLIWDRVTGEVVARPFTKFFNAGEHGAAPADDGSGQPMLAALDPDEPAEVWDKLDGSLGILYPTPSGHAVATRGSFGSEQALHATAVWATRYEGQLRVSPSQTWLFEILYPANRVVVDYGGADDLVLLAVLDTETHADLTERVYWPGPRAARIGTFGLRRALELPPRPNAEGVVLVYPRPGGDLRVKVKQEDYVRLHRIVTGLSERRVWEVAYGARAAGEEPEDAVADLARGLPDEFASFVWETYRRLRMDVDALLAQATYLHRRFAEQVDEEYRPAFAHDLTDEEVAAGRRKHYARVSDRAANRALLWMIYDDGTHLGRAEAAAWRMVRPAGDEKPREVVE